MGAVGVDGACWYIPYGEDASGLGAAGLIIRTDFTIATYNIRHTKLYTDLDFQNGQLEWTYVAFYMRELKAS